MLFSSLTFLLYFLPGVVILHRLLPGGWQNLFLLVASLVFYAWGEAKYLPLIAALLLLNWALGLWLGLGRGRRLAMGLGIALNIGVLGFYKYAGFFCRTVGLARLAPQTTLPLGISFFTFQTLAYLIDVYRKEIAPEKNPVDFSAFILLFPQLIAGPIIRYSDLKNELHSRRRPAAPALERGMALFIGGLSLKVLLANPLGELWAAFGGGQGEGVCSLLALAGYGLQIYYDFFGYSLMAMGVGAMLGFTIPRNFNHPYAAASITDFWRRWHITLSGWFRDYVYIPLGGSRRGRARTALNLLIVWALTGLWHGASWNFVAWGCYYFLLLTVEKFCLGGFLKKHRALSHVYALGAVFLGWALFAQEDLSRLPGFLAGLFRFSGEGAALFWLRQYGAVLLAACLGLVPRLTVWGGEFFARRPGLRTAAMLLLLALCLAALMNSSYNPFLYFRF